MPTIGVARTTRCRHGPSTGSHGRKTLSTGQTQKAGKGASADRLCETSAGRGDERGFFSFLAARLLTVLRAVEQNWGKAAPAGGAAADRDSRFLS